MKLINNAALLSASLVAGAMLLVPMTAAADLGEEAYNANCAMCHDTGAAGAPKLGDAEAWAPRIEKGMDTLVKHSMEGFNSMPANAHVGEEKVKAAVEYMVNQSK